MKQQASLPNSKTAFEQHKAREDHCASWLNGLQKTVSRTIACSAFFGVFNGLLHLLQTALIAFLLHQLIIEKLPLFAGFDFQVLLQLDMSLLFAGLLDSGPLDGMTPAHLQLACVLLIPVFLTRGICVYYFQRIGFEAAASVKVHLRETLQRKFPRLHPDYLKRQQTGALAETTLEQVEALEPFFSRYCPQRLVVTFLPLLTIAIVWPVSPVVSLMLLTTAPLIVLFMALVGMGATAASRRQFLFMARMGGYFLDRLQGITTLKLFGAAEDELKNIRRVGEDFSRSTMAVLRIAFLSSAVLEFFSAVAVALVAVFVGLGLLGLIRFAGADETTLQQGLFLLMVAPEFFMPLKQLAQYYHDRAAAIGAADSLLKVLDAAEIKQTIITETQDFCVELSNVGKSYDGRQIFSKLNLQVKEGEKIALTGSSGSGKSTLLRLLLGQEETDGGEIRLKHEPCHVPQRASIFNGSIRDNISLFNPDIPEQEIEKSAHFAGVTEFTDRLPLGLETIIGEKGCGLSGGQAQRVALARAFLSHAPLVLLDEPTAHLDSGLKSRLLDTIEQLFKDRTLIIATHDPDVIARMQRQIDLETA